MIYLSVNGFTETLDVKYGDILAFKKYLSTQNCIKQFYVQCKNRTRQLYYEFYTKKYLYFVTLYIFLKIGKIKVEKQI